MKIGCYSFLIIAALVSMLGCGKTLPDSYGVYADTNHGQILLPGQGARVAGNMLRPLPGLNGPSGSECSSLKDFIVYEKDVRPDSLGLVKLDFVKETDVPGILGVTRTRINLWLPKDRVDFDVKPIEQRRDMYVIVPRTPLDKGFYALYIGSFGGDFGMGGRVYDLVVGAASDFPSAATALTTREDEIKKNAGSLLTKMNQLLDAGDYQHLQDVYRPEGTVLSGAALQDFIKGNQTWLSNAGRIVKSEIIAVSPLDDNNARCSVKTTYEKAGVQEESVSVRKIGNQYFLTEIK